MLAEYGELIEKRGVIALPEDQNTLDITFATLTYDVPDLMIYEYQLEGYDKEWKILRGINSIKFSNLSPGSIPLKCVSKWMRIVCRVSKLESDLLYLHGCG